MIDQKIPRTPEELDSIVTALADKNIRRAVNSLLKALRTEIDLTDSRGNSSGGFHLILEAAMVGIQPGDMAEHFAQEEAESIGRTKEMLAHLDEAESRLVARRAAVRAIDPRLSTLLAAIEAAKRSSIAAVAAQEREHDVPTKTSKLISAAKEFGIDPAALMMLKPARLDSDAENRKRGMMNSAVGPIQAVLADSHRKLDELPAWIRDILEKMGEPPQSNPAALDAHLASVVALLTEAARVGADSVV